MDGEYDTGPHLLQGEVPVEPGDTVESLATRVMAIEPGLYIEAIRKIQSGEIDPDAL